jgi:protein SCO1/2
MLPKRPFMTLIYSLRGIARPLIGLVGLYLFLASSAANCAEQQHDSHANHQRMMSQPDYARSLHTYEIPDLNLIDMHNNTVSLPEVLGNEGPVMLNFIFTTCTTICPVLSATFAQVRRQLGSETKDLRMISVSIDPEQDSPARLREYARKFKAGDGWQFLTGDLPDIHALQRAFDAYRGDKMNHIPLIYLRRHPDDPWIRLDGFASAAELVAEYHQLASQ